MRSGLLLETEAVQTTRVSSKISLSLLTVFATCKQKTRRKPCLLYCEICRAEMPRRLLFGGFVFDVFNDVADRLKFFGVLIRYFDRKFFFKCHHQFDDIKGVGSQIFDERRRWRDLL